MSELIDNITEGDMPNEDLRLVFRECGSEVALALMSKFGGMKIYVPSDGYAKIKARLILANRDGLTAAELAHRFHTPINTVYKLLREARDGKD